MKRFGSPKITCNCGSCQKCKHRIYIGKYRLKQKQYSPTPIYNYMLADAYKKSYNKYI